MSVRKSILLSLFACTTLQAADFPNGLVPADIAAEFAGGGTLLQGLPNDFPPVTLPPGLDLRVVGTHQHSQYQQTILLRSAQGIDALRSMLSTALLSQGWLQMAPPTLAIGTSYLQLCHDTYGSMTLLMTASAADGFTRVQVQRSVYPQQVAPALSCAEQNERNAEVTARYEYYNSLVPLLEVPAGTLPPAPGVGVIRGVSGGTSGNSVHIEREGTIVVPGTTAAEVHAHFAEQIQAQGWSVDSSATGDLSAASTWMRNVTLPGETTSERVVLSLIVQAGSEGNYRVELALRSPPASGTSGLPSGFSPF